MASIPRTDTPGYRQLHERVGNALDRLQEAPDIEFKESAPWDTLKWKIIKTALAMGNLRDGGILIVGVAERTGQEQRTGITQTDLATYDPDNIADQFGRFISPGIEFTLVRVPYRDNTYLAPLSFRSSARYRWCASGMDRMEKGWWPELCTSGHGRDARAARKSLTPRRCGSFLTLRRTRPQGALSNVEYVPVWSSPQVLGHSQSLSSLIAS